MNYEQSLNEKQYEAVSASTQYLRIIAGAGSGKTRVLTYRIAYLLEKRNVMPYNILAITFTNKVANEMKERTKSLLPEMNLNSLLISTFHSFCARFLRVEADALNLTRNFVIFDEEDQIRLLKTIGEEKGYKKTDDIIKESYNYISNNKTEGILPSKIDTNKFKNNENIYYSFFVEYEKRKSECKALDFDDLLIYTIKILSSFPEIKAKYNNRYKHILIDEFQDTNNIQFELLLLLMNENTNLYVVGDPDQTIYTRRGANQKIILKMNELFPNIETIILNENYRSTSEILDTANKLIKYNKERVEKDLYTNNNKGKKVEVKNLENSYAEGLYVADKILEIKLSSADFLYKNVAILYRSSYLSLSIEKALNARRIPYKVYGGTKFYSRKEIKDCLAYFRLLIDEDDDVSFERIINVPRRKIGEVSVKTLVSEAHKNNLSIIKYLKEIHRHDSELRGPIVKKLTDLLQIFEETRDKILENYEAYSEVLNNFINKIGYRDFLEETEEDDDKLENVNALIDDIRNYLKTNPESKFEDYIQNVSLLSYQDDIKDVDSVSLMTIHTAKGLEFDYVFVVGMNQGVFPNKRAFENVASLTKLEEERRLAYVAFTRAKKELYLSLNNEYSYIQRGYNLPSQFLKEADVKYENKFGFAGFSSENIYKYNSQKNEEKSQNIDRNVIDLSKKNGINWKVGDIAIHKVFGEGKVISVEDEFIVVNFLDYGKKTLLGSHPTLSKKE